MSGQRPVHGQPCFLQLPTGDLRASADFYAGTFGWTVAQPHSGCEAPGLIGQWVEDRAPAGDSGPVIWIAVDEIESALEQVAAHGGTALEKPYLDGGQRRLATVRDPGGTTIGLVQLGARTDEA
jgi:predicted enzyme related to lactoylglutathione lyase